MWEVSCEGYNSFLRGYDEKEGKYTLRFGGAFYLPYLTLRKILRGVQFIVTVVYCVYGECDDVCCVSSI